MITIEEYKKLLGQEVIRFIDGNISFEELEDRISRDDLHGSIRDDKVINLAWHAIYQYETDINVDDFEYAESVKKKMRQIACALVNSDCRVSEYLDDYFNDPGSP